MNILLVSTADRVDSGMVRITDRRLAHLREVLGADVGSTLRVGEVDGLCGTGTVVELQKDHALLSLTLEDEPPEKLPLTLVLALPRPKMLRRILRATAEYGVAELHLINSYRVEKSYWQTPVLAEATVRHYLLQGLEQARDTRLPAVHTHHLFKPFVEDVLPTLIGDARAVLAHPGDWPACTAEAGKKTLLVVGPEGGFIPYEVEKLQAAGCATVSLGPRILRVENALPLLLGKLF